MRTFLCALETRYRFSRRFVKWTRHAALEGGNIVSAQRKNRGCDLFGWQKMVLLRAHSASLSCPSDTKKSGRRREKSGACEATFALAVKRKKNSTKRTAPTACGRPEN